MQAIDIFVIGRDPGADIPLSDPNVYEAVSWHHAELVVSSAGGSQTHGVADVLVYYLHDCASTNGTFRYDRDVAKWIEIRQDFVTIDELIRFGNYQTTLAEILPVPVSK